MPMRISNWSQFANLYSDPAAPDNGPFMEGAYLAHSVYGFFQNGGSLCWIIRVGAEESAPAPARAPAGGHRQERRGAPRGRARGRHRTGQGRDQPRSRRRRAPSRRTRPTRSSSPAGTDREEYRRRHPQEGPHVHRHKGQRGLEADQDRGDRRFAARGMRVAAGKYTLAVPSVAVDKIERRGLRGRRRRPARAWADSSAIDEITMLVMPDIVSRSTATAPQMRDLQGKMIAHCEN